MIPDECDLAAGTSDDCNNKGLVNACEYVAPAAEPTPVGKNRSLSFVPGNAGQPTAMRVTLRELHRPDPPNAPSSPPFDSSSLDGMVFWVGPPSVFAESSDSPGSGTFAGAQLQCTPHYRDWSDVGLLHVSGAYIISSSLYDVQAISQECNVNLEGNYSLSYSVRTARWGDVVDEFSESSITTQPDFLDISAVVDKFKSTAGAPIKARAQLQPALLVLTADVNFLDISACVDAFKGLAFPFGPSDPCSP